MAEARRCPSCYQKLDPADFQCPRCELMLEDHLHEEVTAPREVSVVRALMERPQGTVSRVRPAPPGRDAAPQGATAQYPVPLLLEELVPKVVAGLTLTELSLTPFEAFVVSAMDGKTRAKELLAILQLEPVELQAVLRTLEARKVIALTSTQPAKKSKPPPPPVSGLVRIPAAPPEPVAMPAAVAMPAPAPVVAEGRERATDSRVKLGSGVAKNRKILDALKQVKKAEPAATPVSDAPGPRSASDLAAEGALQVAIRMEQDGRMDEAIRYLERAIARSPDAAPLLNRLAIVLVRDRHAFVESERLLRRALELAPDHPVYKKNLVMVLTRAARERTGIHRRR